MGCGSSTEHAKPAQGKKQDGAASEHADAPAAEDDGAKQEATREAEVAEEHETDIDTAIAAMKASDTASYYTDRVLNRALVFIKPHACTREVQALVKRTLETAKIKIMAEGVITAEDIDSQRLIDKHYYAIASKATLADPSDLRPPNVHLFEEAYGTPWEDALAAKTVLNANQCLKAFDASVAELDDLWQAARQRGDMIKFGGGFYCAKVEHAKHGVRYVLNGFFLKMREKFTEPGKAIYYYDVEWDAAGLPWKVFRGNIIGPTDPSMAPAESIRGKVLSDWRFLGLDAAPNMSDNAVHASASAFEGMGEQMNWLRKRLEETPFGADLREKGLPAEVLMSWLNDAQVCTRREPGPKGTPVETIGSVFDDVEDTDAGVCAARIVHLYKLFGGYVEDTPRAHAAVGGETTPVSPSAGADYSNGPAPLLPTRAAARPGMNHAFVFIKPHAVTKDVIELVEKTFEEYGIDVVAAGEIAAETIDADQLIDKHYYAIASKATIKKPHELTVPTPERFMEKFGVAWSAALADELVYNSADVMGMYNWSTADLNAAWQTAQAAGDMVKFGGGFYCAKLVGGDGEAVYVLNGFFMAMRERFTAPGAKIRYYSVQFAPEKLAWKDFRGTVVGPTDPSQAPAGSLRGKVYSDWEFLGLESAPNVTNNAVHASASPFEGLAEHANWLHDPVAENTFGGELVAAGVDAALIDAWSVDPEVTLDAEGARGSLFDAVEDLDCEVCLARLREMATLN